MYLIKNILMNKLFFWRKNLLVVKGPSRAALHGSVIESAWDTVDYGGSSPRQQYSYYFMSFASLPAHAGVAVCMLSSVLLPLLSMYHRTTENRGLVVTKVPMAWNHRMRMFRSGRMVVGDSIVASFERAFMTVVLLVLTNSKRCAHLR